MEYEQTQGLSLAVGDEGAGDGGSGDGGSAGDGGSGGNSGEQFVSLEALESFGKQLTDSFTSELRRVQGSVDKLAKPPANTGDKGDGDGGAFDPAAFRQGLLSDVYGAAAINASATSLRTEFPHADPDLFSPARLAQFDSPEALRMAAETSHKRVADTLEAGFKDKEATLLADFAKKYGVDLGAGPQGGTEGGGGGDPTPAQLAQMSVAQLDDLEKANPGVVKRVLAGASS